MSKEATARSAMKLALEALETIAGAMPFPVGKSAITALRQALANEALDKKAENARELGLDYEPVCNKDPQGCWNVRCQLGKKCKNTPAQQEPVQKNPLDCGVYLGSGKDHEIKHHVSYGPEPIDTLIAAWQALEETSGHVLDEGNVEGRMHMSVIRSAWEQMDSLVRDLWDERGRK